MDMITVTAKTVDEAVTKALIECRIFRNRCKTGDHTCKKERNRC